MKTIILFFIFGVAAGIITGCSGSSTKTAKLTSGKWNLDKLNGSKITFSDGKKVTLEINSAEGKASGKAPCNTYSCSYDQDGSQLKFNAIMSTKMACEELNTENVYFTMLGSVTSYKITGGRLMLYGGSIVIGEFIK